MAAFKQPGGKALRRWISSASNATYAGLTFQGGGAWRKRILSDMKSDKDAAELEGLLATYSDTEVHEGCQQLDTNRREPIKLTQPTRPAERSDA